MKQRLDIGAAISILQTAFIPAHCRAESRDYGKIIEVKIFSVTGERLLPKFEITSAQFSDPARLALIIGNLRENLTRTGFVLGSQPS
jgi:hypothetical protein